MKKSNRYPPEIRDRAVRLVDEGRREHSSLWAAIQSVAGKIGCTPETLRRWYHQHKILGQDQVPGPLLAADSGLTEQRNCSDATGKKPDHVG